MWVSRYEWDGLNRKVADMEGRYKRLVERVDSADIRAYKHSAHLGYGYELPHAVLSAAEAIKQLAAHIGCEFRYQDGTPERAVLVKKAK